MKIVHYTFSNTEFFWHFLQDIPADSDKSEKRLSTKDELTGQESEEDKLSEQGIHIPVAEPLANVDYPVPCEVEPIGGGMEESTMEREMEWEEVSDFDGDEDSDYGLKIYAVQIILMLHIDKLSADLSSV